MKRRWERLKLAVEEYIDGNAYEPPVDKNNKPITSMAQLKNPTYKPLLCSNVLMLGRIMSPFILEGASAFFSVR